MTDELSPHPVFGDDATGLPPLSGVNPEDTLLAFVWTVTEGIAYSPLDDSTPAVRYLSVRGLRSHVDGSTEWAQMHLAIPVVALERIREALS